MAIPKQNTELEPKLFRRKLGAWYRRHKREMPWRDTRDPYRIWVSEIMLQQTRVAAVIEHYQRFIKLFPTVAALARASEQQVLAAWSGLGYYRRARMLLKAAQVLVAEHGGELPRSSEELRKLPGIGAYTSAAIASIAFGEPVAVVDGNVERVLLRLTGRAQSNENTEFVHQLAEHFMPPRRFGASSNAAGDHNQAMMELGALVCLPQQPLCPQCPVTAMCATRGRHKTIQPERQVTRQAAYLLATRKRGQQTEVLMARRAENASLMPGMLELPPLKDELLPERKPLLRLHHSITNTNYDVQVYDSKQLLPAVETEARPGYKWVNTSQLHSLPLTGLARKALRRFDLMTASPAD